MYRKLLDKERLGYCYQCGKCSSGCDINRLDPTFQPHRFLHLISMGAGAGRLKDEGIWKCTTCFNCSERCPQGIRVTEILWLARAMAVGSGFVPEQIAAQRDVLLRTGRLIPADNRKREKAGLVPLEEETSLVARIFDLVRKE